MLRVAWFTRSKSSSWFSFCLRLNTKAWSQPTNYWDRRSWYSTYLSSSLALKSICSVRADFLTPMISVAGSSSISDSSSSFKHKRAFWNHYTVSHLQSRKIYKPWDNKLYLSNPLELPMLKPLGLSHSQVQWLCLTTKLHKISSAHLLQIHLQGPWSLHWIMETQ